MINQEATSDGWAKIVQIEFKVVYPVQLVKEHSVMGSQFGLR